MTEAHFAAFQTVSADNHPIHYDVEYCRERGHPAPLAHGFQMLCFTAAGAGTFAHVIGDALMAFIEQSSKFLKPVYAGDTLYPMLEIAALTPQRTTGIVTVAVTVHNQRDELVLSRRAEISAAQAQSRSQPLLMTSASRSAASAGLLAADVEMGDGADSAGGKGRDQHSRFLGSATIAAASGTSCRHVKDHDVALHGGEIEFDAGQTGEPLGHEPRIGVVLGEPVADCGRAPKAPRRRECRPGASPRRTCGARDGARPISARRPAMTLPTGQPSPFDSATETRSKGARQLGKAPPRGRRGVEQPRAVEIAGEPEFARRGTDRLDLLLRKHYAAAAIVGVLDRDQRRRRKDDMPRRLIGRAQIRGGEQAAAADRSELHSGICRAGA